VTDPILRHWREAVPDDRLAHLVKDATRALVRALQVRLAEHGVSFGHWTFLRVLWERDGLTQRELSAEAGVMEPTTFTALNAMEKLGYVARRQVGGNRRNNHVFLTSRGRALKGKLVPLAEDVNRIAVQGLPAKEVAQTRDVLLAMIENLAREPTRNDAIVSNMKKSELDKHLGKKIAGGGTKGRGSGGDAMSRREQALAQKKELLEKARKPKHEGS
jgi:MarR family transcriptional regulator, organic hydroperoxide resistance regulator